MSMKQGNNFRSPEYWPAVVLLLLCCDVLAVNLAYFAALWLRFGRIWWQIPEVYLRAWKQFTPLYTVMCLGVFAFVGLYSSRPYFGRLWQLLLLCTASLMASVAHVAMIITFWRRMPRSYMVGGTALQFLAVLGVRVLVWLFFYCRQRRTGGAAKRDAWGYDEDDW